MSILKIGFILNKTFKTSFPRNLLHDLTVHLRRQRLIRLIQEPSFHLRFAQRCGPRLRVVHLLCMGQSGPNSGVRLCLHDLSLLEPHQGPSLQNGQRIVCMSAPSWPGGLMTLISTWRFSKWIRVHFSLRSVLRALHATEQRQMSCRFLIPLLRLKYVDEEDEELVCCVCVFYAQEHHTPTSQTHEHKYAVHV